MDFLHTFHPSPILFSLGPVSVHWYGLLMVTGLVAGYFVTRTMFRLAGFSLEFLERFIFSLVIGGFAGARFYHVLNELPYYLSHPLDILAVWKGGLAIHGALIGGAAALLWVVKKQKNNFTIPQFNHLSIRSHGYMVIWLCAADLLMPGLALGQAIGRWGNYFNQELYGKPTSLPWGIPIELMNRVPGYEGNFYFHPTFLYESLWLIATAFILYGVLKHAARRKSFVAGRVFFLYLLLAGAGRFMLEFLRIDTMPYIFGVRLQQWVSLLIVIIGIAGFLWIYRSHKAASSSEGA